MAKKQKKFQHDPKNKNAVIYARYSSSAQTEQSIEGQLTVCYDYAAKNGYTIIGEYIDRAISGRSDERPQFLDMINDAKKHEFAFVIVYKLDRFSRNRYNSAIYKNKLAKEGVRLLSAMENIGDNPESILLEAIIEASAEYYSIDLAQKVNRGQIESAKKGKWCGGGIPLGYKTENGYLVIDEQKAGFIRYIYDEYAKDTPKKVIIDNLNEMGLRNKRGNLITQSSLQKILTNKKYIGILEQRGFTSEIPAIIEKDLFEMVQKKIEENAVHGGKHKASAVYLLSGKIRCGHCGEPMVGVSGTGKSGKTFYYYSCAKKKKDPESCDKKHEKKDFIEEFVVDLTKDFVLEPTHLTKIAEAIVAEYEKEFNDYDIKQLEKVVRKLETDAENLTDAIAASPAAAQKRLIEKLEATMQELDAEKLELSKLRVAAKVTISVEEIEAWLKSFCSGDLEDEEFRKKMIDVFVNSIYLSDDKIVVYYNVKDTKQVEYMQMTEDVSSVMSDPESVRFCSPEMKFRGWNTNTFLFVSNKKIGIIINR